MIVCNFQAKQYGVTPSEYRKQQNQSEFLHETIMPCKEKYIIFAGQFIWSLRLKLYYKITSSKSFA